MNLFKLPRLAFLLATIALPFALCPAQDKPDAQTIRPARVERSLISLDFAGGPFSKLVASLNKDELSIIQSAGVDPVVPAFSVHEVRVESMIAALGRLLESQGFMLAPVGNNLAVLSKIDGNRNQAFASFQLESKIIARSGRTADDVIAAIQMGCEFANPGQPSSTLRFKYHPGTKLLFVSGTRQEIDVAHQVYASLPEISDKQPNPPFDKK